MAGVEINLIEACPEKQDRNDRPGPPSNLNCQGEKSIAEKG